MTRHLADRSPTTLLRLALLAALPLAVAALFVVVLIAGART